MSLPLKFLAITTSRWLVFVRQNKKVELIQLPARLRTGFIVCSQNTYRCQTAILPTKHCIARAALKKRQTYSFDLTLCHRDKLMHVYGCSIFIVAVVIFFLWRLCLCRRKPPLISDYKRIDFLTIFAWRKTLCAFGAFSLSRMSLQIVDMRR